MTHVGQRIRDEREAAGLSQVDLAERLGITQTAVSYWESGRRVLTVDSLIEIARVLDVSPADLLPDADDDAPADSGPRVTSDDIRHEWCPQCRETSVLRVSLYTIHREEIVQAGEIASCVLCGWTPYVTGGAE